MKSNTSWDKSPRLCEHCGGNYLPTTKWQKACSYTCGYSMRNLKKKRGRTNYKNCARCGASLENKRSNAIYCSRTCKSMDHTFKHRPKTRFVSTARRMAIYNRDNGTCYICHKPVASNDFELDHLVPVSRGGDSSEGNVAVTCRYCNRSRGCRIGIDQLNKLFELRS